MARNTLKLNGFFNMDLFNLSITDLRKLIDEKKISSAEVYSFYRNRIKKLNPGFHAFLTEIDEPQIDVSKKDAPLFGIPFSMKDTYMTKGVRTTAGSNVLKDYVSQYDATVYKRLKDAGAVLIGKTNCDAWGHGSSTENSDFGPTKNPWNKDYVPGGSSGGSACAVASQMSMFDIGEDTGGSIRQPASFCGVVGLKTTYGLVSRYGCIALASSLDTVGPITKTVEDCAAVLEVIAGEDEYDATTNHSKSPKYTQQLDNDIRKMKIGTLKEFLNTDGLNKEVVNKVDESIKMFKKLGAEIVEVSLPMTKYAGSVYYLLSTSETSSNLGRYDGIRYGDARSALGAEAKRRIMLGTFTLSAGYYDAYYKKAAKVRTLIKNDFDNAFKNVDAILAPVSPTPPFKLGEKASDPLQMYLSDIFTIPVNLAGVPSLALPVGFTNDNLPIGIQLIGNHFSEAKLLNIGYMFEKMRGPLPLPNL